MDIKVLDLQIDFNNVYKNYGNNTIVNNLSFQVKSGECYGLLGPNGAGKTTAIKMLLGLICPDQGNIKLCGYNIPLQACYARSKVGVVPQFDNLDEDVTVFENLVTFSNYFGIPKKKSSLLIPSLLEFARLENKSHLKTDDLSGGMKRCLTLARALINDPDVLILDEPTTGLDPHARHLIWQRLRSLLVKGKTILITTHFMEEAERLCDKLCVIEKGKKITEGTPRGLIDKEIGCDVIEIYGVDLLSLRKELSCISDRIEISSETLFCYTNNPELINEKIKYRKGLRYLHRPANLEDVFLRLTGHEIKE